MSFMKLSSDGVIDYAPVNINQFLVSISSLETNLLRLFFSEIILLNEGVQQFLI